MSADLKSLPPMPNAGMEGSNALKLPNILSLTLPYGPDTSATALETLRVLGSRCSGGGRRLLIDLRMVTDQTEGARLCYRHTLPHLVGPVAVVVGPNVSRFLGEFLVLALRSRHEVRLFMNEDHARGWLTTAE